MVQGSWFRVKGEGFMTHYALSRPMYDEGQVRVAIFGSWFMINGSWFMVHDTGS